MPHGKGVAQTSDGLKYDGSWKGGVANGKGIFYGVDGKIICKGGIKDGEIHGKGSYYVDGRIAYKGYWENGKRHGKGFEYGDDGSLSYKGDWENDKKHGEGIFYRPNGSTVKEVWEGGLLANSRYKTKDYLYQVIALCGDFSETTK